MRKLVIRSVMMIVILLMIKIMIMIRIIIMTRGADECLVMMSALRSTMIRFLQTIIHFFQNEVGGHQISNDDSHTANDKDNDNDKDNNHDTRRRRMPRHDERPPLHNDPLLANDYSFLPK